MKPILSILLVAVSCFLLACNRSPSPTPAAGNALGPDVLANVEGQTIRLADLQAELERRARGNANTFAQPAAREALLEELVKFESIYLRAKESGFDQKPEIARLIKRFIVERFTEERLGDKSDSPSVSDGEIAAYYDQNASRYATTEQVRFAVIQFGFSLKATNEKKAEVLRKAESVLAEARALPTSERGFGALAQRYSEDQATRFGGGDAGWLSPGDEGRWDSAVKGAAFALQKAGDLSPLITTANGYYILKLIERKEAGRRPLAEVKDAIAYHLSVAKREHIHQTFYESIKAGLNIEINRPLLESIASPAIQTEARPPSMPAS